MSELRVEWNHLKRHMTAASAAAPKPTLPAFVELVAPRPQSLPECTVELEGRRGKLRILVAIEAIYGRKGIDSLAVPSLKAPAHSFAYLIRVPTSGTSDSRSMDHKSQVAVISE